MQIESVEISKLSLDPANARKHGERNLDAIVASLNRFGQQKPIVIDKSNVVRAGNGTLAAAKSLGWTHINCVRSELDGTDAIAYAIADNRTAELAEWDVDVLAAELEGLQLEGMLDLTGFNDDELAELLKEVGVDDDPQQIEDDEIPDPPADPITKPGDLWILGRHRLLCGDSTKSEDVARLLNGAKPFLMVIDPPYGVEYDANWRNEALRADGSPIAGRATGKVLNDERFDWTDAYKLSPAHVAYVWHAGMYSADIVVNLRDAGFKIRSQVIWKKSNFAIGRGHYHWHHEPCWYAVREGGSSKWCGDRTQSTIWEIAKPAKSETGHSTQKPVECMARPVRNHGDKTDDVHEPFSGSGSTIIACEQLGRACFAMELNPAYVDVAVKRWENLTGQVAYRYGNTGHANDGEGDNAAVANQTGIQAGNDSPPNENRRRPKKQPAGSNGSK